MNKQYATVKELVENDLKSMDIDNVLDISKNKIDSYYNELVLNKSHLCAKPLKASTVNRLVEKFLKSNNVK